MPADAMPFFENAETEAQRIARGLRLRDAAIVNQLVERYQYRLLRYLIYLVGRREPIEDLLQETWLRVLDRASQYDGQSRFEPWLFSIARNLALDELRRRPAAGLDMSEATGGDSPFLSAARTQDAGRLARAMESLDPIYREALLLRFQEELSLQEIAAIVAAPVSTVSSRIHRGLGLLRSQWEGGANAV
jgi:RNA polymerase sigma-70 factor (ECF subfamily)